MEGAAPGKHRQNAGVGVAGNCGAVFYGPRIAQSAYTRMD